MKLMPYLPYFSEIGAIFAKFQVTYFPEMYTFKVRFEFQNVIPSSCQTDNLSRWLAPYWVIYYSKTWEMIKMVRKSLFELISKYLPTTHTCETWPLTWPICQRNWWYWTITSWTFLHCDFQPFSTVIFNFSPLCFSTCLHCNFPLFSTVIFNLFPLWFSNVATCKT